MAPGLVPASGNLIGLPTPQHLTVLFLPAVLLTLGTIFAAALPRGLARAEPG